jgi:hypothetical protein
MPTETTPGLLEKLMRSGGSPGNARPAPGVRLGGFDYFVLAGAGVNLLVIGWLVGHWLFAG